MQLHVDKLVSPFTTSLTTYAMGFAPLSTRSLSPEAGRTSLLIIGLIGVLLAIAWAIGWVRNIAPNSLTPFNRKVKMACRDHPGLCRLKNDLEARSRTPQPSIHPTPQPTGARDGAYDRRKTIRDDAAREVNELLTKIALSINR